MSEKPRYGIWEVPTECRCCEKKVDTEIFEAEFGNTWGLWCKECFEAKAKEVKFLQFVKYQLTEGKWLITEDNKNPAPKPKATGDSNIPSLPWETVEQLYKAQGKKIPVRVLKQYGKYVPKKKKKSYTRSNIKPAERLKVHEYSKMNFTECKYTDPKSGIIYKIYVKDLVILNDIDNHKVIPVIFPVSHDPADYDPRKFRGYTREVPSIRVEIEKRR